MQCGACRVKHCTGTDAHGNEVHLTRCGAYQTVQLSNCSGTDDHDHTVRLAHCSRGPGS